MFQGIQAREGLLGHGFDLVSKQSPAVSKHEGCQYMKKGERKREEGTFWGKGMRRENKTEREAQLAGLNLIRLTGGGYWKPELCGD